MKISKTFFFTIISYCVKIFSLIKPTDRKSKIGCVFPYFKIFSFNMEVL